MQNKKTQIYPFNCAFFQVKWLRNLSCSKNHTFLEADPAPLPTTNMEPFVTTVYEWSSILNVGRGPRPAFGYNGISQNF